MGGAGGPDGGLMDGRDLWHNQVPGVRDSFSTDSHAVSASSTRPSVSTASTNAGNCSGDVGAARRGATIGHDAEAQRKGRHQSSHAITCTETAATLIRVRHVAHTSVAAAVGE